MVELTYNYNNVTNTVIMESIIPGTAIIKASSGVARERVYIYNFSANKSENCKQTQSFVHTRHEPSEEAVNKAG